MPRAAAAAGRRRRRARCQRGDSRRLLERGVRRRRRWRSRSVPRSCRRRRRAPVEQRIDLAVHPAHEEARHRGDPVDRQPLGDPLPPAPARKASITFRVALDREEQRDVDVDPVAEAVLDGRQALACARDLDHHVGPVDRAPEPLGLARSCPAVSCASVGRHLDRHQSVAAARSLRRSAGRRRRRPGRPPPRAPRRSRPACGPSSARRRMSSS